MRTGLTNCIKLRPAALMATISAVLLREIKVRTVANRTAKGTITSIKRGRLERIALIKIFQPFSLSKLSISAKAKKVTAIEISENRPVIK